MMNGITMNKDNRKNKIIRPEGCTLRNDFDKVFLNRHGYYELKEKNTQQERKQNRKNTGGTDNE